MDKSIRKLAVIGAGTMGAAIAACGARAGLDVVLMVRGKGSETGRDRAARAVDTILKKGEMKGSDEARIRAGVFCADMQADAGVLKDCDLAGKRVIPFATSRMTGIEGAVDTLTVLCEGASVEHPFFFGVRKRDNYRAWLAEVTEEPEVTAEPEVTVDPEEESAADEEEAAEAEE